MLPAICSSSFTDLSHGRTRLGILQLGVILTLIITGTASADDAIQSNITSKNWAGYSNQVSSSSDAFTSVSGSWTVPTVTAQPGNTYSGIWVGLDGFNSNTVEQIGILADYLTTGPEYYAFYELYPSDSVKITTANFSPFTINPGDSISAQVTYNSTSLNNDNYTLTITDNTSGQNYSITTNSGAVNARSSAEWIVEAPIISGSVASLADFGSVAFTGASVTLDGDQTGAISDFTNTGINIGAHSGLNAVTSALDETGTSFTVNVVVPEPSTLALAAFAGLTLARRRRS